MSSTIDAWRERLLDRSSLVIFVLGLVAVAAMSADPVLTDSLVSAVSMWVVIVGFAVVAVYRGSYRLRVGLLLGSLFLAEATTLFRVGYVPGTFLLMISILVMCGLLLGVRATIVAWAGTVAFLAIGSAFVGHPDNPIEYVPSFADASDPDIRRRFVTTYAALGGLIAIGIAFTFQSLRRSLQEAEQARAQRDAAQRMEAIGRLASGLAHDFNNSLQVVLGWASLIGLNPKDEGLVRQGVGEIEAACEHSAELAIQLLTLSRDSTVEREIVDLGAIIEALMPTIRTLFSEDIRVEHECQRGTTIFANPSQLRQILFNLALNARKATHGPGQLRVRVERVDAGQAVSFSVSDTGHGMDVDTKARIFDPFFTTRPGDGAGLGLATVQNIVQKHGGTIAVDSEPGLGTTFRIDFPFVSAVEEQDDSPSRIVRGVDGRVVLFVDDDAQIRGIVPRILEADGCTVLVASSRDEALRIVVDRPGGDIDIVCMDVMMPGLGLSEFMTAFRARYPDTPVLVCSAHVDSDLVQRGLEAGEYESLSKPYSRHELIAKLTQVVRPRV